MAISTLSTGFIEMMMATRRPRPVLQILDTEKIYEDDNERYRLLVSDSKYTIKFILAKKLNDLYKGGKLVKYTIIRVDHYLYLRRLSISKLTILNHGAEVGKKIGNPVQFTDCSHDSNTKKIQRKQQLTVASGSISRRLWLKRTHCIADISDWTIKARVTYKSDIRRWSNPRGEGELFYMDLLDESGEIRATAFKEQCVRYYDMIEVDKVYFFSKCQLKPANKQYSSLKNDYEMTFTGETLVQPCEEEDDGIPQVQYNLVPISQIANIEPNSAVDTIGICRAPPKLASESTYSSSKTTNGNSYNSSSNNNYYSTSMNQSMNPSMTAPIASLTPYQNKWVIKARVTFKSGIRTYSNAKGEGKRFNMYLLDKSGEIHATAFKEQCDRYYDMIEVDKVYFFSKCQLKPANKQYSSLKNDYEMTFTGETLVQPCEEEDDGIPQVQYNLVPISQIANIEPNSAVDTIGICRAPPKLASESTYSSSKTTNGNSYNSSSNNNYYSTSMNQSMNPSMTAPIASLTPYQNKWVIKARVTFKSGIRTYSNAKGEGKLFDMYLLDKSGEIHATAFKEQCDRYYDMIEVDKVYFFSKCQLKPANKQYSSLKNDYEMTFTGETLVQPCEEEDDGIPQVQYNLVPISQIANIEPNSAVDTIGICRAPPKLASESTYSSSKTTNGNSYNSSSNNNYYSTSMNQSMNPSMTAPIASLTPYQNKWVIKARVTFKSGIRTYSNAKGEGKRFNMYLLDKSGEIHATAFKEQCDRYYDMIEVDKVYFFSKCQLKPANKQYSSLKNDYEMTFTGETLVQPCEEEDDGIPQVQYNLVPISQIANIEPKAAVDTIGICRDVGELNTFTSRANKEFKKRELTLVDISNAAVKLTLWGDDAEKFENGSQHVILVKGATVSEFDGGKSLSMGAGSVMKINPDIPEAHRLRRWLNNDCSKVCRLCDANVIDENSRSLFSTEVARDRAATSSEPMQQLAPTLTPSTLSLAATSHGPIEIVDVDKTSVDDGHETYVSVDEDANIPEEKKIQIEILKARLERSNIDRDRAKLKCKRAVFDSERAEIERDRSAILLKRQKKEHNEIFHTYI